MHRSGTSVITRAINLLGAYLGKEDELHPPTPANQEGYWERIDLFDLHNRILFKFGGAWDTVPPIPDQWYKSEKIKPYRDELIELIYKNFANHPLWAWKDPRTCLLFPLWKDILDELGIELSCIYVVRNPLDVVKSIHKRDGLPYDKSFRLWFSYNIEALQASHTVSRYFMSYDRFLNNWESELRRCTDRMKIDWPEDDSVLKKTMNKFIHLDLRHNISNIDELKTVGAPQPVLNLYELLENIIESPSIPEQSFMAALERLYGEVSSYKRVFDIEKVWERLIYDEQQIGQLKTMLLAQQQEIDRTHADVGWKLVNKLKQIKNNISFIMKIIRNIYK